MRFYNFTLILIIAYNILTGTAARSKTRSDLIAEVHQMFNHSFTNYIERAFPGDELKSITGTYTNTLPELGNGQSVPSYQGLAMTLIDSLDTLAVFGWNQEFRTSVKWIVDNVDFDLDLRVHVFETNIRFLGGLLSGHWTASNKELNLMPGYGGELLSLAEDLADRIMPAFDTSNGIPYAWVNLRNGVKGLHIRDRETCLAGVGTLILEFGALSHYTGDPKYFNAAHKALLALWDIRSKIDLMGNTIHGLTGKWNNKNSGIGAGTDSYYEYLLKAYVAFGNEAHWTMFSKLYASISNYLRREGGLFVEAKMDNGGIAHAQFNSLQAFWPGLEVLRGSIPDAQETMSSFFGLWSKFDGLPERVLLNTGQAHGTERHYPLRPELIESAYHLYQATKNPLYKDMGQIMLRTIQNRTKTTFGYAILKNVVTGELEDYMPSYFLAETLKYLLLLFDEDHWANKEDHRYLFSTEAHFIPVVAPSPVTRAAPLDGHLPPGALRRQAESSRRKKRRKKSQTKQTKEPDPMAVPNERIRRRRPPICPRPPNTAGPPNPFLLPYSKEVSPAPSNNGLSWTMDDGRQVAVELGQGSFRVNFADKMEVLEIRNLGSGVAEIVNLFKSILQTNPGQTPLDAKTLEQAGIMNMQVAYVDNIRNLVTTNSVEFLGVVSDFEDKTPDLENCKLTPKQRLVGSGAFFFEPPAPLQALDPGEEEDNIQASAGVRWGGLGCEEGHIPDDVEGDIVLMERGKCTFLRKTSLAEKKGAVGVIIGNNQGDLEVFMMSGDGTDTMAGIPAVMVSKESLAALRSCLQDAESHPNYQMRVAMVETQRPEGDDSKNFFGGAFEETKDEGVLDVSGTENRIRISTMGNGFFTVTKEDNSFRLSSP